MKLPAMVYADEPAKTQQIRFKGYNHTYAAGDGELYNMENLCGLEYPVLSTRPKRRLLTMLTTPNGLFGKDKLCWVDGTSFCYDGVMKGTVADSRKTFAAIGPYIIILPDKKYYNTTSDEFGDLESTWSGGVTFRDGTLYGETAEANTIYAAGVTWSSYFRAGDAVTISGCIDNTGNNKTPVIREIDDTAHTMSFYEHVFTNGSEAAVTIKRTVPNMDHICACSNRLWGFKGDTICASKLGDPFNWNVFDGLDTDAWSMDTGSAGGFSGAFSYLGYPSASSRRTSTKYSAASPEISSPSPAPRWVWPREAAGVSPLRGRYFSTYPGADPSPIGEVSRRRSVTCSPPCSIKTASAGATDCGITSLCRTARGHGTFLSTTPGTGCGTGRTVRR